jgi:hypothetical protein
MADLYALGTADAGGKVFDYMRLLGEIIISHLQESRIILKFGQLCKRYSAFLLRLSDTTDACAT